MTELETKIEYTKIAENKEKIPVIIVAAGSSSRMNGRNKQFLPLCSVPVLARTMLAFERCEVVSDIIVVCRADDIFAVQMMKTEYGIKKLSDIVSGGKCRQESVLKGLERVDKSAEKVLIHDGARPFVTEKIINGVADKLRDYSAVICAVKVKDTVKIVNENGEVLSTPDRESLVLVQTPQGVRVSDYKSAIQNAGDLSRFTDDASIMENAGYKVAVSPGDYKNIKITTPEDIVTAEGFIKGETEF